MSKLCKKCSSYGCPECQDNSPLDESSSNTGLSDSEDTFNLSDKIFMNKDGSPTNVLNQDYVVDTLKEFIKRLKKEFQIRGYGNWYLKKINKLAGKELC